MKKSVYKTGAFLLLALLLAPFVLRAEELSKEFHKEYKAGPNTTLNVDNKYGDIVIQSWDKDQIVIDVRITVEHPNQDRAQKYLDQIDVQFSEGTNSVSAKTVIDDKFSFSGWGGDSKKFSIDYTISMPAAAALSLSNKYGNTDVDDLSGKVNMDIRYGSLTAGKLTHGNEKPWSSISLAYSKGTIDEASWLDLTIRYVGSFSLDKCQALMLDSKYSKLTLGEISSLVGESRYDNVRIEKVSNLVFDNGYCDVKINELTKKLKYSGSYGSLEVQSVPTGFERLDTDTRYLGVKLGIEDNASYKLNANLSYGGLKYDEEKFRNQKRIIENNKTEISGIVGEEENPKSEVNVSSSYGSVKLY
jgi:hypothetical protein